jgi:hypothetical protein
VKVCNIDKDRDLIVKMREGGIPSVFYLEWAARKKHGTVALGIVAADKDWEITEAPAQVPNSQPNNVVLFPQYAIRCMPHGGGRVMRIRFNPEYGIAHGGPISLHADHAAGWKVEAVLAREVPHVPNRRKDKAVAHAK